MKVSYDRLWKLLVDRKMTKTELRRKAGITTNALAKMGREEPVTMECICKICSVLCCSPDDILAFKDIASGESSLNTYPDIVVGENLKKERMRCKTNEK